MRINKFPTFVTLLFFGAMAFVSCEKPLEESQKPRVTTLDSPMVYYTNAEVGLQINNADFAKTVGIYYGTEKDNLTDFSEIRVKGDGEYTTKLSNLKQGEKYYYKAYVDFKGNEYREGSVCEFRTFVEGPVDLGLPSGLKWASVNLGAEYPTESGGYYAWGETRTKQQYDYTTYLYGEGKPDTWTKYYSRYMDTDGKTALDPEDDAARQVLGGSWRMPTAGDFLELVQNCASKRGKVNGTLGVYFYNKKTMDESVFIFFPCSGQINGVKLSFENYYGYYWSSNLVVSGSSMIDDSVNILQISDYGSGWLQTNSYRIYGETIRPVCD